MEEILNISEGVTFEERITNYQHYTHQPFTHSLNNSDEIIISVQQQDIFTVPSKSFLYIQGQVEKDETKPNVSVRLVSNAFMYLFDEIKNQLNGVLVDHVRNPGIVSTLKGYVSFNSDKVKALEIAG
ncbi:uncharacterized protein [Rhodnius prolixus]|uniref:Y3 protein n=1 Tax=Rhodnius prolixus TaxID=13249 RepID=A0A141FNZ8_RHOPR|nr:Y3 protein [Rhodnius prolixus]